MTVPPVKVEFGFGSTWQTEPASITWTDETAYVMQPERIIGSRGASSARGEVDAGALSLTLKNGARRFDSTYTAGTHYGDLVPGVPVRVTRKSTFLALPGAVGDYASTPDKAALDITGDLDLRVHCALDDWTPATVNVLCSNISTAAFTGYDLQMGTLAIPTLRWGTGAANLTATATAALTTANGEPTWLKATLDVNDGAGNHVVEFYTSDDGANWTQLGDTVTTAGTTSIAASAQPFYVGIRATSLTLPAAGDFYRVQVRNGIDGTLVVDTDFTVQTAGATSFSDDLGNTWTVTAGTSAAITAGTGIPVWYGHVAKWPQRYEPGGFSWVPVECYGGFDKLARAKIPRSVMEAAIVPLGPVGYWPLNDPAGSTTATDVVGVNFGTVADEPVFGSDPITPGLGSSVEFDGVNDRVQISRATILPDVTASSIVAAFKTDTVAEATSAHIIFMTSDGNGPQVAHYVVVYVHTDGTLCLAGDVGPATGVQAATTAAVTDGEPHLMFAQWNGGTGGIAVDTTTLETSGTTNFQGGVGAAIGGTPSASAGYDDNYFVGQISDVAVFDFELSGAQRTAILDAFAGLNGQTADERIGWILDELDWPANLRDFETGQSTLGPATFKPGDNALDYLRLVTRSEDGLLFTEADGTLRFLDRYWRFLNALATEVQFTFTDADADQSYAEFQLDLDDELLVNVARLTRRDGTEQVASDTTSVNTYGEAELSYGDLLLQTDNEVLSLAEWKVATGKTPLPRVPSIKVPLHRYSTTDQGKVLRLDLGHRVRCVRTPSVGSAITLDFLISGISHSIGNGEWWWEAFVSPVPEDTVNVFRWDVSTWDGSDVWAY